MASTRFRMIGVALFVVALSALEAMQWDGGLENKAKMTACVGGNASIPWSFVTGDGETIASLAWWFQAPGTNKTQIATSLNGHFYSTDKERFGFLPNAGLFLHDAKSQDSGDYFVHVGFLKADLSPVAIERAVTLFVTDTPPATQDGDLDVTMRDAVCDDVKQESTVPLHCGHFLDLGHPPVGVVWTLPSGEVKNSSYADKDTFVLSLSSSVQGGIYSCRLSPSAPAVRCLNATSPLNAAAELYVDVKDVKLALQSKRIDDLTAQIQDLNRTADNKDVKLALQSKRIDDLKANIDNINRTIDMFKSKVTSCKDWLAVDRRSGVRPIYVSGQYMAVYCDQVTDNGGWAVFQRRKDASLDFYRGWTEYRNGFGDPEGNFWLGLDKLHKLTTSRAVEMRVDMRMFDKWNVAGAVATYSHFSVEGASRNFRLRFHDFTGGRARDSLMDHRGSQFSTYDKDHDPSGLNCAIVYHGAWWYSRSCGHSNLNGDFKAPSSKPEVDGYGTYWKTYGGYRNSLAFTEMKIR